MKIVICLLFLMMIISIACGAQESQAAINLFGYTFDDNAFSDNATYISGDIDYWGFSKWGYTITGDDHIDLDTALNNSDLYTMIEGVWDQGRNQDYVIEIDFIDNVLFNGAGIDLTVWERGLYEV